jgi:hypothetical protein
MRRMEEFKKFVKIIELADEAHEKVMKPIIKRCDRIVGNAERCYRDFRGELDSTLYEPVRPLSSNEFHYRLYCINAERLLKTYKEEYKNALNEAKEQYKEDIKVVKAYKKYVLPYLSVKKYHSGV